MMPILLAIDFNTQAVIDMLLSSLVPRAMQAHYYPQSNRQLTSNTGSASWLNIKRIHVNTCMFRTNLININVIIPMDISRLLKYTAQAKAPMVSLDAWFMYWVYA